MSIYHYSISGLINGILAITLGVFVYTRDPSDRRYITYGIFCLSLAIWSFSYFLWLLSPSEAKALFWVRALMAGAVFIPVTAYHHVIQLIGVSSPSKDRFVKVGYLLCVFLFLLSPTPFLVSSVSEKLNFVYWPNPGPAFHFHSLMFLVFASGSVFELYQGCKSSTGRRRNHLRILLANIALAYLGGSTNYLLWYDIPIPPVGNILIAVYIGVFAYAIIAYRLMDINVVIKKSLIYALLLLGLLAPCYVLVIWTQKITFGTISYSFSVTTLILFFIVGFLFPKFRFRTEEALERVLFKKRYDYRETLLRSSRDMVSMVDLETLSNSLVHTVGTALGIEKASLFLLDDARGAFDLKAGTGFDLNKWKESVLFRDDPLVQRLMKRPEAIVREEVEMARDGPEQKLAAERMGQLKAEISLPITSKTRLIGILNLGYKEGREMYSNEDLELLSTLANQAAIAIENARLYENLKQSQSIIRRADRLSSLGMLTAGLAHEIRNPLVAIRTFTQLLPDRYQDKEFREGFQSTALKEVDRICGLVNDLLSFARPSVPNVSAEHINEIVENIIRILETEAKEKGVQIYRRFSNSLPKIFIDKEQIKQVSMNIILNALQSIEDEGVVEVSTQLFTRNGSEQFVQIGVRDSGVGIAEKDLEDIFTPFFTTKKEGSGLGLSISHQIVQEHGGHILVESKAGKGTTFFINLPVEPVKPQGVKARPQVHEEDPSH